MAYNRASYQAPDWLLYLYIVGLTTRYLIGCCIYTLYIARFSAYRHLIGCCIHNWVYCQSSDWLLYVYIARFTTRHLIGCCIHSQNYYQASDWLLYLYIARFTTRHLIGCCMFAGSVSSAFWSSPGAAEDIGHHQLFCGISHPSQLTDRHPSGDGRHGYWQEDGSYSLPFQGSSSKTCSVCLWMYKSWSITHIYLIWDRTPKCDTSLFQK